MGVPESFPECSPEETGIGSGIMDADSRRAHPQSHLRPRLRSGNKKSYEKDFSATVVKSERPDGRKC